MFTDPLVLGEPCEPIDSTPAAGVSLPLVNDLTSGNTLRRAIIAGDRYDFSSLVQTTKENKPMGTKRLTTRLSRTVVTDGVSLTSFAQMTTGQPLAVTDPAEVLDLVRYLCFFYLYGDGVTGVTLSKGAANFERLLAGEV